MSLFLYKLDKEVSKILKERGSIFHVTNDNENNDSRGSAKCRPNFVVKNLVRNRITKIYIITDYVDKYSSLHLPNNVDPINPCLFLNVLLRIENLKEFSNPR